ncbi:MAG: DUF4296 domain-containing protein [Bacteroidota bacterium]
MILDREKMTTVLLEYHLADAIVDNKGGPLVQRNIHREEIMDEILDKEGVNREIFYKSYQYYLIMPAQFDSIYVDILDRLQVLQDSIQAPAMLNRTPPRIDTTKKVKPKTRKERSKKS